MDTNFSTLDWNLTMLSLNRTCLLVLSAFAFGFGVSAENSSLPRRP